MCAIEEGGTAPLSYNKFADFALFDGILALTAHNSHADLTGTKCTILCSACTTSAFERLQLKVHSVAQQCHEQESAPPLSF